MRLVEPMNETRKVIRQSNRLTITLPYRWTKKYDIQEGDELPIYIDEEELAIFPMEKNGNTITDERSQKHLGMPPMEKNGSITNEE